MVKKANILIVSNVSGGVLLIFPSLWPKYRTDFLHMESFLCLVTLKIKTHDAASKRLEVKQNDVNTLVVPSRAVGCVCV